LFRSTFLALALLLPAILFPGFLHATQNSTKDAPPGVTSPPCSDHDESFTSCGVSSADRQKANDLYRKAAKLARHGQFEQALEKLQSALAISPKDTVYATAEQALRQKVAALHLRQGNEAIQVGDAAAAQASFRRAQELDPSNDYAAQRLRDVMPQPTESAQKALPIESDEVHLDPTPGAHDFEFRGSSTEAFAKFAALFGITTIPDDGFTPRNLRITLDNVDWETGSQLLAKTSKTLLVPLTGHQVLLANDTTENRNSLTDMSLRTFYAQGGSTPQQLTDLTSALRVLFDLRFVTPNADQGSIVVRAPGPTLDAVARFLDDLRDDQPTVMLEVQVFEVSTVFTKDLGVSTPDQFSVFNIPSEIQSLTGSSSFQQIIAALEASGQSVNATTILAALLASGSTSNPLAGPFATFGGGMTLSAVSIAATNLHYNGTDSLARTVDEMLLRSEHGNAATMKVGERYPIVTTQFSATTATSSLLSTLGVNIPSSTSATSIPTPQFSYEDLGLVLKATPQVHGKLISVDYELTLRSLGATQAEGPPVLNNRESKGSINTGDGKAVVIAGLVDKGETSAINGIPLLSAVPVLGKLFSVETREKTADELLIVVTPYVTSTSHPHGIYLPVPMNVPK
jgi:general secretion pathway protein D